MPGYIIANAQQEQNCMWNYNPSASIIGAMPGETNPNSGHYARMSRTSELGKSDQVVLLGFAPDRAGLRTVLEDLGERFVAPAADL